MLWEKTLAIKKKRCFLTIDDARVWHYHAGNMATGMLSIALSFVCNHIPRYSGPGSLENYHFLNSIPLFQVSSQSRITGR